VPVLFKIEDGALRAVKKLDPNFLLFKALTKRWEALPEPKPNFWDLDVVILGDNLPTDASFSDGHLYSMGRSRDNGWDTIVVTNVDTEAVTWFRPEVPEDELELAT